MKVKNFLIFQGAVESIAMKNARERCQMFEEISRSAEYKEEYDRSKAEMQKLEEEATLNLNKKKNIVAERKEARIEIDEAEKYTKLHSRWVRVYIPICPCSLLSWQKERNCNSLSCTTMM